MQTQIKMGWSVGYITNADMNGSNTTDDVYVAKISTSCISTSNINVVSCNTYISPSGNYIWSTSGSYLDTIPNALGCDSIITINLTIDTLSSSSSQTIIACDIFTSPSTNYNWTNSGTYFDTISNAVRCDSVITIYLTIINSSSTSLTDTICTTYLSPSGNHIWTTSGLYHDTIPNASGCDSIITLNLTFKSTYSTQSINSCFSYTSPSGILWTTSGYYHDTIPNSLGCDSIMDISLTIKTVNTSVTQNGNTLTANATGSTFQWLDCNNGFAAIPGATNKVFTAAFGGSYAVGVSHIGCTDTSTCYSILGQNEISSLDNFQLIPNPTTNHLTITLPNISNKVTLTITDITGKIIYNITDASTQKIEVNTKDFSSGVYFVQIQTPGFVETKKLVVAK